MSDLTHLSNHLKHLEEEHHRLNKRIDGLEKTGLFSDFQLEDLKKQKLHIKDEIAIIKSNITERSNEQRRT
jgi:hypothetical protein